MKKLGRPPLHGKTMDKTYTFRCTPAEKKLWKAKAAEEGLSLSAWVRREADARARLVLGDDHPLVIAMLARTGG